MRNQLVQWQWQGYPDFHRARATLLVHAVAVPAFVVNALLLGVALVRLDALAAAISAFGMVCAFAVQGVMHKRETTPPIPFDGPVDVVTRILAEQFITFPRFVLSGGFVRAWRAPATPDVPPTARTTASS
jgi:hypothetical protein